MRMMPWRFSFATLCLLALIPIVTIADVTGDWGGGPPPAPTGDCLSAQQRAAIELAIRQNPVRYNGPMGGDGPASYPFQPIAGTVWQDRFINNFVDLNNSSGILDWDCTGFTYDGHRGHDIDLRSFGEQDVGVPIFAALDGTVVDLHDGEFDRNTAFNSGAVANYVVLDHGMGHRTFYLHMRKNSVAVGLNQFVKAGTQLGLAGSSGYSTGPHLHFESQLNSVVYEPYAGACQQVNPSRWVNQIPIRRDLYLAMFAMHGTNNVNPFLPENPPRKGTFIRTGTFQSIGCWYVVHNQSANSTWRLRYKRPNGTVFFDSGTQNFNNPFYRWGQWWFYYNLNPDTTGTWALEVSMNGQILADAPFTVLNSGAVPVNRPPNAFTTSFDPPSPNTNDVIFCRVNAPLLDDVDYDLVRYRYEWKVNNVTIRNVTNGAFADALPHSIARNGDFLTCTVTACDGVTNGPPVTVSGFVGGPVRPRLNVERLGASSFIVSWPTSGTPYLLELNTNLSTTNWLAVTNGLGQSSGQNVITNPGSGELRFFRLRFP